MLAAKHRNWLVALLLAAAAMGWPQLAAAQAAGGVEFARGVGFAQSPGGAAPTPGRGRGMGLAHA